MVLDFKNFVVYMDEYSGLMYPMFMLNGIGFSKEVGEEC